MPTWYVVVGVALTILGFLLSLQGLWITCRAIWSKRVLRAAERCRTSPVASFFVGLVITAGFAFFGAVAQAGGSAGKGIGFGAWCLFFFAASIGTSGFVTYVGQRLASPIDDLQPWRATLRGGIAVSLSWLLPVFGWFILPPFSILIGVGAMILSYFGPREERALSMQVPPLDLALSARMSGQEMPPEYRPAQSHEGVIR